MTFKWVLQAAFVGENMLGHCRGGWEGGGRGWGKRREMLPRQTGAGGTWRETVLCTAAFLLLSSIYSDIKDGCRNKPSGSLARPGPGARAPAKAPVPPGGCRRYGSSTFHRRTRRSPRRKRDCNSESLPSRPGPPIDGVRQTKTDGHAENK